MLMDILFPKKCVVCSANGADLCTSCASRITPWHDLVCPRCLRPCDTGLCLSCAQLTFLDDIRIAADYDNMVFKKTLHAYKYDGVRGLATPLAHMLLPLCEELNDVAFVSVPLHTKRQRQRGFNQIDLLLDHIHHHIPLTRWHGLQRVHFKKPLMGRDAVARAKEIHGAFRVTAKPPKHIVVIDDVMSSGATLEECAKMLTFAGCDVVTAIVLSRKK